MAFSKEYDVIIIGAGVGGLSAAARLVKAGLSVLVLERNPHPGGTAYVYQRRGFTFPMGPLGFSHRGTVEKILKGLGAGGDLQFDRVHYRLKAFDVDIPLSLPFSEVSKEMAGYFPGDSESIENFFSDVRNIITHLEPMRKGTLSVSPGKENQIALKAYLESRVQDWRLRRILGSLGTREPYSVLSLQGAMWNLMSNEGIWYPRGGMRSLIERLVHAVTGREKGDEAGSPRAEDRSPRGVVKLRTEVLRIRTETGRVLGVTLADGTTVKSASVISNADFKTTFLRLVEPEAIPPAWTRAVSGARQTGSVLQVCLGVHRGKVDLSCFEKASRLIYRRRQAEASQYEALDWNRDEVDPEKLAAQELEVSLWSWEDKALAPRGEEVIVIRTEAPYSHFSRFRTGVRRRVPPYGEYKMKLARGLIEEIENLMPGLGDSNSVIDVATPLTFEDQGGRSEGAVAGWSWDYEDSTDWQPRELIRTPIQGLYMAGYQAFSALFMGGVPTAMESGSRAAAAVLQGTGPTDDVMIPGRR